jgi:hypothetical protein
MEEEKIDAGKDRTSWAGVELLFQQTVHSSPEALGHLNRSIKYTKVTQQLQNCRSTIQLDTCGGSIKRKGAPSGSIATLRRASFQLFPTSGRN